ncbi:MAG: hypothetical protein GTO03_18650, partial [Planctomycetales bacterium]|nr:hypothetical protein [Planctomycetales bacterium]
MTERERWIVYPLLLLGLGASLKDKLVSPSVLKAEKIECNSLQCRQQLAAGQVAAGQMVVVDPQRQPKILLRAIPARQGNTVLKGKTQGQISLFDESNQLMCAVGQPIVCTQLVAVGPVEIAGGWLRLYDRAGKLKAQLRSAEPGQLGADQAAEPQSGGVTSGRFELYGADPTSIVTMGALEQGG